MKFINKKQRKNTMTKLIKTNLLKNNNTLDIAKVTASTTDYCNYRYHKVIKDMSFKEIFVSFFSALFHSIHSFWIFDC